MLNLSGSLAAAMLLILIPISGVFVANVHAAAASPVLTDNFNSNSINLTLWQERVTGKGPSVVAANQRLEVFLPGNSSNDPASQVFGAGLTSVCLLRGDFDIQVDFNLLVWPQSSGVRVGLWLRDSPVPIPGVERTGFVPIDFPSLPRELYLTDFGDGVQGVATSDLTGTLRVTRAGATLSGYYLSSGSWILIHSGPVANTGDSHFGLRALSHNAVFGNQDVKVAYDNFAINSGQLFCPTPVLVDHFNSNSINSTVWTVKATGTGPSLVANNGRIEVTLPSNSVNDPSLGVFGDGLGTVCPLGGDFDIQVDFNLLVWPQSSGVRVGVVIQDSAGGAVERIGFGPTESLSLPREAYLTHFADGVNGVTQTSDLTGTLRLVRTGGTFTGYYLSSGGWVLIHSGPATSTGDLHVGFWAWSHNALFGGQTVTVDFDNFVVSSGRFDCPRLRVSPTSGTLGTQVQVLASGFPVSPYGPEQVLVSFDDQFLGVVDNTNGSFAFTFNVPHAQVGHHAIKAMGSLSSANASTDFTVLATPPSLSLAVLVDTGPIYFPGNTVVIYVLTTENGQPVGPSSVKLQMTIARPNGSITALNPQSTGTGTFTASFSIPKTGSTGTYAITVAASTTSSLQASALRTFEVKPGWVSPGGSGILSALTLPTAMPGVALIGMVIAGIAVAGLAFLTRRREEYTIHRL